MEECVVMCPDAVGRGVPRRTESGMERFGAPAAAGGGGAPQTCLFFVYDVSLEWHFISARKSSSCGLTW